MVEAYRQAVVVGDARILILPDTSEPRVGNRVRQVSKLGNISRQAALRAIGVYPGHVHEFVVTVVAHIVDAQRGVDGDLLLNLQVPFVIGWILDVVCDGVEVGRDSQAGMRSTTGKPALQRCIISS